MSDVNVPTRVPTGVAAGGGATAAGSTLTGSAAAGSSVVGSTAVGSSVVGSTAVGGPAAVQAAGAGPLIEVACPGCGTPAHVRADRRTADDFCATCDHPLFWAGPRSGTPELGADDGLDARFRAPGVVGTSQHGALACPQCAEQNHATWSACVRCGSELNPPPPVAVLPAPAPAPPQVVTVERPADCEHPPAWVVALVTALVTAAVVAGIFLALR